MNPEDIAEAELAYEQYLNQFKTPAAPPTPEPTFMDSFTSDPIGKLWGGVKAPFQFAGEVANNYNTLGTSNPLVEVPAAIGKTLYAGAEGVEGVARRTGELALGVVPGGATAFDYLADVGTDREKTPGQYGEQLSSEMLGYGGASLLGLGVAKGRSAVLNSQTRGAAKVAANEAYLTNPSTEAALRLAENYDPNLITPTVKDALWAGKATPELEGVVNASQGRINNTVGATPDVDYLPGVAMGYPESSASGRPMAASEIMAKGAPALIESQAYTAGDMYNPISGKFEGPRNPKENPQTFANKLEIASTQIIDTRRTIAENLDFAAQTINREKGLNLGTVDFATDIAPTLGEIEGVIAKRDMLAQTSPMSAAMADALSKTKFSFERLKNRNYGEKVPVTVSETLSILEDMNAFRKSLGEFDEMAKANGLNSTVNDFAGRAAELYSLSKVQDSIQSVFETKANEILGHSKGITSPYPWQQVLSQVTDQTLPTMNKNYGAFQTAKEAAVTNNNTTMRGLVAQEPGRLITTNQQASVGEQLAAGDKSGLMVRGWNKAKEMTGFRRPQDAINPALQRLEAVNARPDAAISQVLDGLLLREKPVPILSRDWKNVKASPEALKELNNRAVMLGFIAAGQFEQLSDPMRQQLLGAVTQANPQGMEASPQGLNLGDQGAYLNPMEKDAVVRENLDKSPAERYKYIAKSWEGKYPLEETGFAAPAPIQQLPAPALSDINMMLGGLSPEARLPSTTQETDDMVSQMFRATELHRLDDEGYTQ